MYIIYWTIISTSAPRGGATWTLLITLNFIDLTNCNNCVYGFYSKFGWFINDCKTHGFLMNFTRMKSKSESPRICLRTKIPTRNYISTEMNPPNEYSANYLICRIWAVVKKILQKHFCLVSCQRPTEVVLAISNLLHFGKLLSALSSNIYYWIQTHMNVTQRYDVNYLILLRFYTRNISFLIVCNCLYSNYIDGFLCI